MRTTTVRELRNNYSRVLAWVAGGEEVEVTRRGKVVARVVPPAPTKPSETDWASSAALNRPAWSKALTEDERVAILTDSQGG